MPLTTSFTRAQLEDGASSEGPLETIKRILEKEGLEGLYRGCVSTCESVCVSNFVYFYTFHALKNRIGNGPQTPMKDLLFACLAGSLNVLMTNPLWVVNSRMKMSGVHQSNPRYKGLLDGLIKIQRLEGVGALWNGTKASLMLVSNPAIKFTVYELLKRKLVGGKPIMGLKAFLLGAASTAVATMITYPAQMVQAKARNSRKKLALKEIYLQILREDGLKGLFKGLDSKLVQSMVAAGFMFLAYEKIAVFVFSLLGVKKKALR